MLNTFITHIEALDVRYELGAGEGADAVHQNPQYAYAVTLLQSDGSHSGIGLAFTLGGGNQLVCDTINLLAAPLLGREIEELMADFATIFRSLADHPQLRWLGAHKGVVHLALASIVNACFDLWAKSRGLPLWKLLLELTPEQTVALLDLSHLEDVLPRERALELIRENFTTRGGRFSVLTEGYPGYDTSAGWFHYSDRQIRDNVQHSMDRGFSAMKLKIGSAEVSRDIRRAHLVREVAGDVASIMLDANQRWSLPEAVRACIELAPMNPYWIEEPLHPDDVLGHQTLARAVAPVRIALGEHVPHRVLFKNFLQAGAASFIQADCTRVGGVSEFLTVSLLCRHFGVPLIPHVGDMGQIHQHLVLYNHIALDLPKTFLEYIPHLRHHFVNPAQVEGGVYLSPQEPGSSSDLLTAGLHAEIDDVRNPLK